MQDRGYCSKCDIVLPGRFCRTCGTVLVPKPANPKCICGEELYENDHYCRWCSREVEQQFKEIVE